MDTATAERFQAFSGQHWLILAIFAFGVVAVAAWGRSHAGTDRERRSRRGYAVVLAAAMATMLVYYALEPGPLDLGTSLPLELCDLAEYAAVVALWTGSPRATAFTYYVALTLSVQAILTPSLGQAFPSLRYLGFWTLHLLVVWAAVYLTWGLGFRPTWRLYRSTCLAAVAWAVLAYLVNDALGTDFGYLNRKPSSASLLDLLGPWPWYVAASAAIVLAGWALVLTLPWQLVGTRPIRSRRAGPGRRG